MNNKNDIVPAKLSPAELWLDKKSKEDLRTIKFIKKWLEKNPDGIIKWI